MLLVVVFVSMLIGPDAKPALAHDLVLIATGSQSLSIEFGHPQAYQSPDPDKLIHLDAYVAGQWSPLSLLGALPKECGGQTILELQPLLQGRKVLMVSAEYDNGFWSANSPTRYFNTSKVQLAHSKDSGYFLKFAKALFPAAALNRAFEHALGMELEILPLNNPFRIRTGDTLPVQILWRGKPIASLGVEVGDGRTRISESNIPRYKTNENGIALVPISQAGLQVIAVDYRTPPRFPQLSDYDDYGASLTFFVPDHGK